MEKDVISREERGHDLLLGIDLDFASSQVGKRVIYLGIPIFKTLPYSPPPNQAADKYQAIRRWFRHNIEHSGGIFIIHRRDLQRSLDKAQPDAVDYLVTMGDGRANREGWSEPGNEAVEIGNWILPTGAVDKALVTTDFLFHNIFVTMYKDEAPVAELHYFITPKDRTLYFSKYGRPQEHSKA